MNIYITYKVAENELMLYPVASATKLEALEVAAILDSRDNDGTQWKVKALSIDKNLIGDAFTIHEETE